MGRIKTTPSGPLRFKLEKKKDLELAQSVAGGGKRNPFSVEKRRKKWMRRRRGGFGKGVSDDGGIERGTNDFAQSRLRVRNESVQSPAKWKGDKKGPS